MTTKPRIYVADLAAYNAGYLHGVWIDATQEIEDIQEEINALLKASPVCYAEEYAIHDYEGFDGYSLGEYAGIETAHNIACFIEDFPDFGAALISHLGVLEEAREAAENNYCGCYTSLADYAQELTEERAEIPSNLTYYIDYERMARDMEISGDIYTVETSHDEVHVFWNH